MKWSLNAIPSVLRFDTAETWKSLNKKSKSKIKDFIRVREESSTVGARMGLTRLQPTGTVALEANFLELEHENQVGGRKKAVITWVCRRWNSYALLYTEISYNCSFFVRIFSFNCGR